MENTVPTFSLSPFPIGYIIGIQLKHVQNRILDSAANPPQPIFASSYFLLLNNSAILPVVQTKTLQLCMIFFSSSSQLNHWLVLWHYLDSTAWTWPLFITSIMTTWYKSLTVLLTQLITSTFVHLCSILSPLRTSVQSLSCVQLFVTPWTAVCQDSLSITNSWSLLKLKSIESVIPSTHLILCCPLLQPSIFSSIRVFLNESALHIRWPKYWNFSFSISPSNDIQGWFPLGLTGWISLQSKGLSRVFSNMTVKKHQFFDTQLYLQSNSHIHTWLIEKP